MYYAPSLHRESTDSLIILWYCIRIIYIYIILYICMYIIIFYTYTGYVVFCLL